MSSEPVPERAPTEATPTPPSRAAKPSSARPVRAEAPEVAEAVDPETARAEHRIVMRRIFLSQAGIVAAMALLALAGAIWPEYIGSFWFGFLIGGLGASIALLRRLSRETTTVRHELAASLVATGMPLLYGCILAGMTYLMFLAGILSGDGGGGLFTSNLFPNFAQPTTEELSVRTFIAMRPSSLQDVGKLLVWCFLAGFSERFVLGILRQLERRGEAQTA